MLMLHIMDMTSGTVLMLWMIIVAPLCTVAYRRLLPKQHLLWLSTFWFVFVVLPIYAIAVHLSRLP